MHVRYNKQYSLVNCLRLLGDTPTQEISVKFADGGNSAEKGRITKTQTGRRQEREREREERRKGEES